MSGKQYLLLNIILNMSFSALDTADRSTVSYVSKDTVHWYCSSVIWHCWLGVRKSVRLVEIEWWINTVDVLICLERDADCFAYCPAYATAMPKPHHLVPHLNPDWFNLSGTHLPTYPGRPRVVGSSCWVSCLSAVCYSQDWRNTAKCDKVAIAQNVSIHCVCRNRIKKQ